MASSKESFNYYSELWQLLSHIILSQTCFELRHDSIQDSQVENRLGKIDFADLAKEASFSPSC